MELLLTKLLSLSNLWLLIGCYVSRTVMAHSNTVIEPHWRKPSRRGDLTGLTICHKSDSLTTMMSRVSPNTAFERTTKLAYTLQACNLPCHQAIVPSSKLAAMENSSGGP
jgi:hypothetical protein